HALKLADGTPLASYAPGASPGPIGPINGTPTIDYATRRVYFASLAGGGDTLFCLELNASPVFTYRWSRNLGPISGSPVLRGGRLYVGTDAGLVYSLDAMTGGGDRTIVTADGPVKGFLFPDRRNDDLMFATDTKVWSVSDSAPAMAVNWTWTTAGLNPSVILYWPTTNLVYVGSRNGQLYELDFTSATLAVPPTSKVQVLGDGLGQVGAPSLDIGVTPRLLVVGSEAGVVYGLDVPFP
ncbi:MAG: PQQ-binding-like beta-propeller repeat protein, partial [Burkholderiales bacterium]